MGEGPSDSLAPKCDIGRGRLGFSNALFEGSHQTSLHLPMFLAQLINQRSLMMLRGACPLSQIVEV